MAYFVRNRRKNGKKSGIMLRMTEIGRTERTPVWNPRELVLYFALAYGISFILRLPILTGRISSRWFFSIGTFGPTIAALITHRIFAGNWRAVRLWTTLPDFLLGSVYGAAAVLIAAFTSAFFMTKSGIERWQWPVLLQILTLFAPNLLGGPLGEEPGWRGYGLGLAGRKVGTTESSGRRPRVKHRNNQQQNTKR